jgi:hypothetical protein
VVSGNPRLAFAIGQELGVIAELSGDDIKEGRLLVDGGEVTYEVPLRDRMGDRESPDRPEFIPDELGRKGEQG